MTSPSWRCVPPRRTSLALLERICSQALTRLSCAGPCCTIRRPSTTLLMISTQLMPSGLTASRPAKRYTVATAIECCSIRIQAFSPTGTYRGLIKLGDVSSTNSVKDPEARVMTGTHASLPADRGADALPAYLNRLTAASCYANITSSSAKLAQCCGRGSNRDTG